MQYVTLAVKYWPAVVAGLYLAYVVAAGNTAQIVPAVTAFLAAAGLGGQVASAQAEVAAAHSRIDSVRSIACRTR